MEANSISEVPNESEAPNECGVVDCATLYLCRQGRTWVVVIESPRVTNALLLRHPGHDSFDARFELLSRARLACPDAVIESTDGAVEGADYEWRLEVRAVQKSPGDLGVTLHHELSGKSQRHQRRLVQRQAARCCRAGTFSSSSGRPLSF